LKRRRQRASARLELTVLPPLAQRGRGTQAKNDRLQVLARLDGAQVLGELKISGGKAGEWWRQVIAGHELIRAHLAGPTQSKPAPGRDELRSLGHKLFSLLFTKQVRALYEEARRARSVELVFTSLVPWIADKPWELLCDPRRGFVARGKVRFSRSAPSEVPARAPSPRRGAMRLLVAVAEPRGEAQLSGFEESKSVAAGFLGLEKRGLLQATVVQAATLSALRGALRRDRYDVLHFVGHGGWDAKKDRGFLLFEGETGEPRRVAPDQLVSLLRARGLRLLVLNACESGRGSRRGTGVEFNRGVAPALLAAGLPAVLANQYPVFDRPAASFAERFYAALGQGRSLSDAVHTARISIARDRSNSPSEWAVPVLYARDPTQRLCAVPRRRSRAAALVADGIES
jgi:hypothetical protein